MLKWKQKNIEKIIEHTKYKFLKFGLPNQSPSSISDKDLYKNQIKMALIIELLYDYDAIPVESIFDHATRIKLHESTEKLLTKIISGGVWNFEMYDIEFAKITQTATKGFSKWATDNNISKEFKTIWMNGWYDKAEVWDTSKFDNFSEYLVQFDKIKYDKFILNK